MGLGHHGHLTPFFTQFIEFCDQVMHFSQVYFFDCSFQHQRDCCIIDILVSKSKLYDFFIFAHSMFVYFTLHLLFIFFFFIFFFFFFLFFLPFFFFFFFFFFFLF